MPHSDTGERVTPVLEFPSRDGLVVQAIRVAYEPAGFTRGTHRHPAGVSSCSTRASARPSTTVTDWRRRVFVAGASGLIGVRPVPQLVGAGHDVAGLTRPPARVERPRFVTEWLDSEAA